LKEGDIKQQENATDKMVRFVGQLLHQHSPINLFEFVINPRSFGQTIENIFYLSFNVRDARAKIELDARKLPIVSYIETLSEEERSGDNKQCVLEMTMDQWEVYPSLYIMGFAD
jgi:non-structural maintenance of chromosomes element 4